MCFARDIYVAYHLIKELCPRNKFSCLYKETIIELLTHSYGKRQSGEKISRASRTPRRNIIKKDIIGNLKQAHPLRVSAETASQNSWAEAELQSRWLRICRSVALGSAGPRWGQGTIWMKGKKDSISEQAMHSAYPERLWSLWNRTNSHAIFHIFSTRQWVPGFSSDTGASISFGYLRSHSQEGNRVHEQYLMDFNSALPLLWVSPCLVLPAFARELVYKLIFLLNEDLYELQFYFFSPYLSLGKQILKEMIRKQRRKPSFHL